MGSRYLGGKCDKVLLWSREIRLDPDRKLVRLPPCYFVRQRNSVTGFRAKVGMILEITEHLSYLCGHGEAISINFLWNLLE